MNGIENKAMLVSQSISVWTARRFDRKVTSEVAVSHNTTDKAGRYNKNLLPLDAPSYKAIVTASGEARTAHYSQTLPWSDEGSRILPAKNYLAYNDVMRVKKQNFESLVQSFIVDYPYTRDNALRVLNGLGNVADYPDSSVIGEKFSFTVKFLPFPTADDFRVTLQAVDVDAIKATIQADTQDALKVAMRDPFKRLHEAVSRMQMRLADPDAIFRDSLVNNIAELCQIIPNLNLTGDPELDALAKQIEAELIVSPDSLRASPSVRGNVAAKAAKIQADLAGYME